ncbi:MAG TPA: chromosomal replication initiator protein DnaA [Ilumatobacteraceae bacterium]|nr:chromosomal replication initiator protein DnaA [Ilumatobacteraceae bacterium]
MSTFCGQRCGSLSMTIGRSQVTESADVWTQVTLSLRSQLAESVWFSTFQDVSPLPSDDDTLRLLAPSAYVRDRILSRYLPLVTEALQDANEGHRSVEIDVETSGDSGVVGTEPDLVADATTITSVDIAPGSQSNTSNSEATRSLLLDEAGLNPRYTFETFVKGASNQFALAAALRVAETPARSYNPLFIYGSAGLGKTHLLHAIGHYVHSNYQHHEVRYVSTETFMNEYVDAIRQNTTNSLRRRYRDIDVLLIDDIQFIAGKEGLQEEFFHTFNSLHGANKQVVISSDRMPDAIPTLEERLRGRFKWGLITDIQPPDLETRLAILRNKSERDRVLVPDETLEFIATNIATNIRELEGALIRVTAFASLNQVPITTELAETQLADLLTDSKPKARTDDELLADIAAILKFPVEDLKGRSRQRPLVTARQIAMYVFRELTDLSYPAIARLFGGRDHTTVIHANEKIQRLMSERKQIYDQVTDLLQQLKA